MRGASGRFARPFGVLASAWIAGSAVLLGARDEGIPEKPQRYVTDRAGVFGTGQAEALNAKLEQFERDTSSQILVWIDRTIPEGYTLEDFTVRAAQAWGAGQKQTDNGAVLFVFTEDRKVRIEVGYGLEGVLPDITAKRIIENEIIPRFREGDYAAGAEAGAEAMMAATRGEYRGTGRTRGEGRGRRRSEFGSCLAFAIFFGVFFVIPMLIRRSRSFRTHGGRGWWTGGWGGGWGGGGWGGGGGFSGGGFSGGGGSFGGGGASGSW